MENSRSLRGSGRYAWLIIFLVWTVHLILSARDFIPALQDLCVGCLPGGTTPIQASTGSTWAQLISSEPRIANYLASILTDDGISGVSLAIFGMVVAYTGYRKGEKWAWYISWLNPIGILAAQLNLYLLTGSVLVLILASVFIFLCLAALFLPYKQFFPSTRSASSS
jgi:hypothetical protein